MHLSFLVREIIHQSRKDIRYDRIEKRDRVLKTRVSEKQRGIKHGNIDWRCDEPGCEHLLVDVARESADDQASG